MKVVCPYCDHDAVLVNGSMLYGSMSHVADQNLWVCWQCDAWVGCHIGSFDGWEEGTRPLGILAKKELRDARVAVHDRFDKLWKLGRMDRGKAYKWLADRLGISKDDCHIGMFDMEKCIKTEEILEDIDKFFDANF